MNHLEHLRDDVHKSTVEIVGHSIDKYGNEIVSAVLTYPLFVHAELMTHRMFSRNAASGRAIPGASYRRSVKNTPVIPYGLQKNHSGMQGNEYLSLDTQKTVEKFIHNHMLESIEFAEFLEGAFGVTKQYTNRLLSPFSWIRVLVTTGDKGLENFFKLRCHKDAEIHIMELATTWKDKLAWSVPKLLGPNEWHIVFQEQAEVMLASKFSSMVDSETLEADKLELLLGVATGMAARTSYTLLPEEKDWQVYKRVHDKMLDMVPFHASPFEHNSQCLGAEEYFTYGHMLGLDDKGSQIIDHGWVDNFKGFKTYRHILEKQWEK